MRAVSKINLMQEEVMKKAWIGIFFATMAVGVATAQDSATPGAMPPTSQPSQTQTTAPPESPTQPSEAPHAPAPTTPQAAPQAQAPAQSEAAPAPAGPRRVAAGSVIPVSLTKTIDAKKAKTGDEVVARVMQDLKTNSGEVLIAKDTKVTGHVTEAQARSKDQKESQVGIAFDRAVPKNGTEMQMPMSIQAIIGTQNDQNGAGDAASTGGSPGTASARPGMAGSAPSQQPAASAGGNMPGDTPTPKNARPQITGETQGVVGIADLKLTTAAANAAEGSVVSSEKNNVKLESGTMMLLRVNQ